MSKILITGGAGFIGSAIVKRLSPFYKVYVIDNLSYGKREFIDLPEDQFFTKDILDRDQIFKIIHKVQPDHIIHLAAIHFIPDCNKYPFESARINIQGTRNILDAAAVLPHLKNLFFASTAAVYPIRDHAVAEIHPTGPMDIYGLSKLTGEYLCEAFHQSTGIPVVVGRFFNAFGPNETNPHLIPEIERQLKSGKRTIHLGNLEPMRDFVYTFDMAELVIRLIEKFDSGYDVFNIGRGEEYSVLEVVKQFQQALGESIRIEQDPSRIRKVERMHLLADVSKVVSFTGYSPQMTLQEGIKHLMNEEQIPGYSMH
jgi:UDP-glucose 4-epimerase